MENNLTVTDQVSPEIIQSLVLNGDLSKMNQQQKVDYYNHFCQSLGLNPLTQPFQILKMNGKEILYARKDCTEQLRKIYAVSITELTSQELKGVFVVTAKAVDKTGKTDAATGAVNIEGLKGEALANALMKAETKAKRRVTLSICGLGMLDESELETMPTHETKAVTVTNEINLDHSKPSEPPTAERPTEDTRPWLSETDFNKAMAMIGQGKVNEARTLVSAFRIKKAYKDEMAKAANFSSTLPPTNELKNVEISNEVILEIESAEDVEGLQKVWNTYATLHNNKKFNDRVNRKKKELTLTVTK